MPREAFKCSYDEKTRLYRKRVKDSSGKYIALYDRDKGKLKKKCDQAKRDAEASLAINDDIAVWEYANRWYKLNTVELSPSRKSDYKGAINNYIIPQIGKMRMVDVRPDDAKRVLAAMNGMSYSMQVKTVTALKQIFNAAEENRLILRSPCSTIKAGGYKSREKIPLTNEQSEVLIEAVNETSAHTFVMIGLYTGMRREEILGLKWDCVHLGEVPYIEVRRVLTFDGTRPVVSEKLKSPAARRDIPLPERLAKHLREKGRCSDFVVCNSRNEEHTRTTFKNMWKIVVRRKISEGKKKEEGAPNKHPGFERTIDFMVSPHILRHTYITNLILSGMNIKKVQYLAGHSKIQITLDIYTKLIYNKPEDLIGDVSKAFSG